MVIFYGKMLVHQRVAVVNWQDQKAKFAMDWAPRYERALIRRPEVKIPALIEAFHEIAMEGP